MQYKALEYDIKVQSKLAILLQASF